VTGALLLLSSAGLGVWAHDLSQTDALRGWERSRSPSERIWLHALGSRGFKRLDPEKDGTLMHRALRVLPGTLDAAGSAWLSSDGAWALVFVNPDETVPFRVFCLQCRKVPERWDPLGTGWKAFDLTLEKVDHALTQRPHEAAVPTRPNPARARDPREIRY
jgi:hypothetical protein